MIIDFHAHTFPDFLAAKALNGLSVRANIPYYTDGTETGIKKSMEEAGIDISLILPVVTKAEQTATVNRVAIEMNDRELNSCKSGSEKKALTLSFGGLHPENTNYKEVISSLAQNGIKGIKLHPVFQNTDFDDIRYKRIVACAMEHNLWVTIHAGYDLTYPDLVYVTTDKIRSHIRDVRPDKLILAHMGGYGCWNETEELLADYRLYLDTAFTINRTCRFTGPYNKEKDDESRALGHKGFWTPEQSDISEEQFLRLVKAAGADHILFGSDSPWTDQVLSVENVKRIIGDAKEQEMIFSKNAKRILGLA